MQDDEIQLNSLGERRLIEALDIDHLVDELADGIPPRFLTPDRLRAQNLVVLATETCSGRYLGLLGARDDLANGQEILRLELACVAPMLRGRRLATRLLARLAAERERRSPILVARTASPGWLRALHHFAARVEGAAIHPAPPDAVVALRTTATARRIAAALYPEYRYDLVTGRLHGTWTPPARSLLRHAASDAWYEAAPAPAPVLSGQLLALVDLRLVRRATLLALARHAAATG